MLSKEDWSNIGYASGRDWLKEDIPTNLPKPNEKGFTVRVFVDSDSEGDTVTRRSRTGFLIYLQSALIYWTSKKQTTMKASSVESKFMAMKHTTEYVCSLRYKLRTMGIPIEGCTSIYSNNQSVL